MSVDDKRSSGAQTSVLGAFASEVPRLVADVARQTLQKGNKKPFKSMQRDENTCLNSCW